MSKIKNGGLDQYAKCKAFNGIGAERVKCLYFLTSSYPQVLLDNIWAAYGASAPGAFAPAWRSTPSAAIVGVTVFVNIKQQIQQLFCSTFFYLNQVLLGAKK